MSGLSQTLAVDGQSLTVTHSSTQIGRPTDGRIYRVNRRIHAPPNRNCFLTKLDERTKLESPNPNQHADGVQKKHATGSVGGRHGTAGGALRDDQLPRTMHQSRAPKEQRASVSCGGRWRRVPPSRPRPPSRFAAARRPESRV